MSQVVRIPRELYERLSLHAKGFETPASVIEKLLNYYEAQDNVESTANIEPMQKQSTSIEIVYYPTNEEGFKKKFLKTKKAYVLLHKVDGTTELKEWKAVGFKEKSSVNGNLRSGILRGWKNKGIFKAEISTNRDNLN